MGLHGFLNKLGFNHDDTIHISRQPRVFVTHQTFNSLLEDQPHKHSTHVLEMVHANAV
jgi:hypothetical protein